MSDLRFLDSETLVVVGKHPEYPGSMERRLTIKRSCIVYLIADYFQEPASRKFEDLIFVLKDGSHRACLTLEEIYAVEAWWIGIGEPTASGHYKHDYKPITIKSEKK